MRSEKYWTGVLDQSSWACIGEGRDGGLRYTISWTAGANGMASEYTFHVGDTLTDDPVDIEKIVKFGYRFEIHWKSGKVTRVFYESVTPKDGELPKIIREVQPVAVAWDISGVWRYSNNPPADWVYL